MKTDPSSEVQRTILQQNEFFEIVEIAWTDKTVSPMHNHGWSQCHVLIQEGTFENTLQAGAKTEIRILETGQVLATPVGASHQLRCLSAVGKTLHVYSPKISARNEGQRKFTSTFDSDLRNLLSLGESVRVEQLEKILSAIQENSVSTHSPYFMNQLFSGIMPQALRAEVVIAQTKATMATQEASQVFSAIECEVIDKLGGLIGWQETEGLSVPGGSAANAMALQLARQRKCPEIRFAGMKGHSFRIFVSSDAHYSFDKAALTLGFGVDAIVKIAVDESGRMDCRHLSEAIGSAKQEGHTPLLVCATAGTTVYGAFDSIAAIHKLTIEHGMWLHVDGAWGGPALFSKRARDLVDQISLADSITFDAHKLFGASLTCSFLLTKHKGLLLEANDVLGADYLFHDGGQELDRGRMSWQCGRRADALSFWSLWKNLGTEGLGDFVDRLLMERDKALQWIRLQSRLEIVKEPTFLNLCVRVLAPDQSRKLEWSKKVREYLKEQNLAMVNYSSDQNGTFLRLILAHPQINAEHVRQILNFALDVK